MRPAERKEAHDLTMGVTQSLMAITPRTLFGTELARLRYYVGIMQGEGMAHLDLEDGSYFVGMMACFDQALRAGADYEGFDQTRLLAQGASVSSVVGIGIADFCVRMALIEQARLARATTFTNREAVDALISRINDAFEPAEMVAADRLDAQAYQALIALHSAVVADLTARALPLPTIVPYHFPETKPAAWIAYRLYQDPSRIKELIDLNGTVHPMFMQPDGVALSE